jgi:hypothetical protein
MVGDESAGAFAKLASSKSAATASTGATALVNRMFLHVLSVAEVTPFELLLVFSDGVVKRVDLRSELHGEVFEPLNDPVLFGRVFLNPETGTIE